MPISAIPAQASRMSVAERPTCDRNPAPREPTSMPPNINVLPNAMTAPRRSAGARHWMSALIGTLMKPLAMPSRAISVRVPVRLGGIRPSARSAPAMHKQPGGIRPISIFEAERRPASAAPMPMPMPRIASGRPDSSSDSASRLLA